MDGRVSESARPSPAPAKYVMIIKPNVSQESLLTISFNPSFVVANSTHADGIS
jgi:hypothetical protein